VKSSSQSRLNSFVNAEHGETFLRRARAKSASSFEMKMAARVGSWDNNNK
jgi:hypothetical protein